MKSTKVLFIATSHDKIADTTEKTGVGLEEIAVPYICLRKPALILHLLRRGRQGSS